MKLVRCAQCRTVVDAEEFPQCPWCETSLDKRPATAPRQPRDAQREAAVDRKAGSVIVTILGALAALAMVLGFLTKRDEGCILIPLGGFITFAYFSFRFTRRVTSAGATVLIILASLGGAVMITFLVCAAKFG
jgi:hypothetical protein